MSAFPEFQLELFVVTPEIIGKVFGSLCVKGTFDFTDGILNKQVVYLRLIFICLTLAQSKERCPFLGKKIGVSPAIRRCVLQIVIKSNNPA